MRLVGIVSETAFFVFFVLGKIAVEKFDLRVAFKGENMRGDAIQKPAVVRNDNGTAAEIFECFFERAHRVDIEIVGRFVEKE